MNGTSPSPPLPRDRRKIDAGHLKLLAVFHFVGAGLAVLGILFLLADYLVMQALLADPKLWEQQKQFLPPAGILAMMKWFYVVMGFWLVVSVVLNLISGFCLLTRRCRIFSVIVAGVNCLHVPVGTVLGVFTFIVLLRDSVRELYGA
jgi:hypothetical protein